MFQTPATRGFRRAAEQTVACGFSDIAADWKVRAPQPDRGVALHGSYRSRRRRLPINA